MFEKAKKPVVTALLAASIGGLAAKSAEASVESGPTTGEAATVLVSKGLDAKAQKMVSMYKRGGKKVIKYVGTEGAGDNKIPITAYSVIRKHDGLYDWFSVTFTKIGGHQYEAFSMIFGANQKLAGNPNSFKPAKFSRGISTACVPNTSTKMTCAITTAHPGDTAKNLNYSIQANQNFGQKIIGQSAVENVSLGEAVQQFVGFEQEADSFLG